MLLALYDPVRVLHECLVYTVHISTECQRLVGCLQRAWKLVGGQLRGHAIKFGDKGEEIIIVSTYIVIV